MKKPFTLLVIVLFTVISFSQVPEKMSYQAVVRNSVGELVRNSPIGIKINIFKGDAAVYEETHTATTNNNGLVTLKIGGGTIVSEDPFSSIDWSQGPYYLETEIDPEGGTNYTITGNSQILTVPYALYAKTVASYPETDPTVKAINGIVKSNGTTISAAVAGDFPTLNQNTTGNAATATTATTAGTVTTAAQPAITSVGILTGLAVSGTTTVSTPVNATDAATKEYVDNLINKLTNMGLLLKDIDGNIYSTVRIGSQIWMAENLKTTKYNDGTSIPLVTDNTAWSNLTTPGYCWYGNNAANKDTYGALYNWYTVNTGILCPTGWHVPTDAEWTTMENYLIANGFNYDGTTSGNKYAKALASTSGWAVSSTTGAVGNTDYPGKRNATGFTALPGGDRSYYGSFSFIGYNGSWWSATEDVATTAWYRYMICGSSNDYSSYDGKKYGFSVRCVRD